jgi:mRNA interferase MazF
VLIISADAYNRSNLATVTVAVVTSTMRLAALPGNVAIPSDLNLLAEDSVVNATQAATIDRAALESRIGVLPDWLQAQVDAGISKTLGLERS